MSVKGLLISAVLAGAFMSAVGLDAQVSAITEDGVQDKEHPAAMQSFQLPSHGSLLNAFVYVAAGAGPHPTVVLLHGFPGNERNLDVAQSMRRAGWNVLYFNYRGSWGSPGDFSLTHCIEDTRAAIAYLRDAGNAAKLRSDGRRIVLVGHSMGGFMALQTGALEPEIAGVIAISAADFGTGQLQGVAADKHDAAVTRVAARLKGEGMAPLAGTSGEALAEEVTAHAAEWSFANLAGKLATRPVLVITSDDGLKPPNDALVEAMKKAGDVKVNAIHLATDHSYSDQRIALQKAVLDELGRIGQK